jgi:hypothetical protein
VQRVHPDGVAGRLDVGRLPGRLEDAELRLELRRVPAEGVEGVADAPLVEPLAGALEALQRRQGRQAG